MKLCQSCAMPLQNNEDFGTNADNTKNDDYCCYCFKKGKFTYECTMDELIEQCAPMISNGNPYKNIDEAKNAMKEIFPTLKRWTN